MQQSNYLVATKQSLSCISILPFIGRCISASCKGAFWGFLMRDIIGYSSDLGLGRVSCLSIFCVSLGLV